MCFWHNIWEISRFHRKTSQYWDWPIQNWSHLALFFTIDKLKYYMQAYMVHLIAKTNLIKYVLSRPVVFGRIARWAVATRIWPCIRSIKSYQSTSIGRFLIWSPSSIWLRVLWWFLGWRCVLHWSNATMGDVFRWGYTSRRSGGRWLLRWAYHNLRSWETPN